MPRKLLFVESAAMDGSSGIGRMSSLDVVDDDLSDAIQGRIAGINV